MRSNKEFLEEVYSRGERYKAGKRKHLQAVIISVIPVGLCLVIGLSIAATSGGFFLVKKSAKTKKPVSENYTFTADLQTDDITEANDVLEDELTDDYEDVEDQSQIHYPNDEIDGDYSIKDGNLSVNKSQTTSDKQSQASSKKATADQLKAPYKSERDARWDAVVSADSFTVTYQDTSTYITGVVAVDKMEEFLCEAAKNVVEYSNKSEELITIEMGGMKFKLRSSLICNETLGENYLLNEQLIEGLRNIFIETDLLADNLAKELDNISKSFDNSGSASSAAVTNDTASESAYKE